MKPREFSHTFQQIQQHQQKEKKEEERRRRLSTTIRTGASLVGKQRIDLENDDNLHDCDHNAVLFEFSVDGRSILVLSWNIHYCYGETENLPVAYNARLTRTISDIEKLVKTFQPTAIMLQECPSGALAKEAGQVGVQGEGRLQQMLREALAPHYKVVASGGLLTAVVLNGDGETVVEAVEIPVADQPNLQEHRHQHRHQMHAVCSSTHAITFVNVHFVHNKHNSEQATATKSEFDAMVTHLHEVKSVPLVVAGTFNRIRAQQGALAESTADTPVGTATASIEQLVEEFANCTAQISTPPGPTHVRASGQLVCVDHAIYIRRTVEDPKPIQPLPPFRKGGKRHGS
jgi:endonuclease/exonuclease/phosphatase family metal-dependent hydrolase